MKYLETLTEEWYINGFGATLDKKLEIVRFMQELKAAEKTKRLYWHTPGIIKHIAEYWLRENGHPYVERASCVGAAILLGIPVRMAQNPKDNLIGLHISPRQMDTIWQDAQRNGRIDLKQAKDHTLWWH